MKRDDVECSSGPVAGSTGFGSRIGNSIKENVSFEARFTGMASVTSSGDRLSEAVDEDTAV